MNEQQMIEQIRRNAIRLESLTDVDLLVEAANLHTIHRSFTKFEQNFRSDC